ncbi:MAG: hypothetical protein PUG93_01515 [Oscillospiraceae bacterium]|nr:hypothetical protein [Oscillospiraceae bacterium]MDD7353801.1 hypothetical protein [Oscillospiraceae bacterium]MDY3937370.1 hypothetical protein [Oscillospiraceae bacterium]
MADTINQDFIFSYGNNNSTARSGGIISSIMFRFLAVFVNIIENLKKYF